MKAKWLCILLIVLPYPCLGAIAWLFAWHGSLDLLYLPLALLVVAGTVPNVIQALYLSARAEAQPELVCWMRRIKLWHVPFYLLLFAMGIAMIITIVGLLLFPLLLVTLYAALLPASLYTLAVVRRAKEQGILSPGQALARTVQLFLPGLDVLATLEVYACVREETGRKG